MADPRKVTQLTNIIPVAEDLLYVVDDVSGVPTSRKLLASSLNRNFLTTAAETAAGLIPANFTFEPGDVRRNNLNGNGSTDDATELNKIFAAYVGLTIKFEDGKDYAFASQLTIPGDDIKIEARGAKFTLTTSIAGNTAAIKFESGGRHIIDHLEVEVNTGVTIDRLVVFNAPGKCDSIKVTSVDQQNNRSDTNDACIRIVADDFSLGTGTVNKFDNAYQVFNCNRINIDFVYATSYVRGINFELVDDLRVGGVFVEIASANATTSPGHNGVLFTDVQHVYCGKLDVRQAGEHGVRFGSGTAASEWVHIDAVHAFECGQCGFKINDTNTARFISVGSIFAIDNADTSTPGSNEDGVRLERCTDITIGEILVGARNNSKSGFDGMFINAVQRLQVGTAVLRLCDNHGVEMVDTNGILREISFGSLRVIAPDLDAININSPTEDLADIHVNNFYARAWGGHAVDLTARSTTVGIVQPCTFTGKVHDSVPGTGVLTFNTSDKDLQFDIKGASISEVATGTFTCSVYIRETQLDSSGGAVTATLPDGDYEGQRKVISMSDASNSSTLSITSHETSSPEVAALNATTDYIIFEWSDSQAFWWTDKNIGVTFP